MLDIQELKQFPFFEGLADSQLAILAEIGQKVTVEPDKTMFQENDPADHLFALAEGEVELSLIFKDRILKTDVEFEEAIHTQVEILEKPIIIERIMPGHVFGWSALTQTRRWTLNARTVVPSKVISLPVEALRAQFENDPQLGFIIMDRLSDLISQRMKNRTDILIEAWGHAFAIDPT